MYVKKEDLTTDLTNSVHLPPLDMTILPTGYTTITEGIVDVPQLGLITSYSGQWSFPPLKQKACDKTCDCVTKW